MPVCVHVGSGRPAAAADRFDNAFFVQSRRQQVSAHREIGNKSQEHQRGEHAQADGGECGAVVQYLAREEFRRQKTESDGNLA